MNSESYSNLHRDIVDQMQTVSSNAATHGRQMNDSGHNMNYARSNNASSYQSASVSGATKHLNIANYQNSNRSNFT